MLTQEEKYAAREYYKNNRERILSTTKKYYKNNREQIRSRAVEKHKSNPERRILACARYRARKKNLPFTLALQDIVVPSLCPVFGTPLVTGVDRENAPSLDRLDPKQGYSKGNVWVISYRANRIKNDASLQELLQVVRAVQEKVNARG